jgi:membrane protease YdiL (CAAX protease family)
LSDPGQPGPVPAPEGHLEDRPPAPEAGPAPARPGASIFTIEGRAAPGLFVVGWLATILGGVAVVVGAGADPSPARAILILGGLIGLGAGLTAGAGSQAMERRARGAAYTGPSPFLLFGASVPISLALTNVVALPLVAGGADPVSPLAALIAVTLTAIVYVGLVRLLVVDHGALTWAEMGIRRPGVPALGAFAGGAVLALPAILATGLVAVFLAAFLPLPPPPLPLGTDGPGILANLVAAAIVAPLGEELFFRGFATTAWRRVYGQRRALVQGALFFAFVHVLGVTGASAGEALGAAATAFVARLPISLLLGWVFLRRGSLWASVGLHATFNLVLLLLALAGSELAGSPPAIGR